ncbi:MAG: LPP20 family lipoprotein [Arcobacteraceae bacterium]|nr:LPP20 family lipoprotein [Arcobacteraceae bacterium]
MKYLYFILTSLLLMTGCIKQNTQKIVQEDIPQWYLSPIQNNQNFIYGTGEGYSLDEAKNNALNDISSRLIVSVSSTLNTTTFSSSSGNYSKNTKKSLNIESQKIKFNNPKIKKSTKNNQIIYIMMQVNRDKLFTEKRKEFIFENQQLTQKYKNIKTKSLLEQIFDLKELKSTLIKSKNKAYILYAINNNFDYSQYINNYNHYLEEENRLKSIISISISTNNKNEFFKDILSQKLNKNNYKLKTTDGDIQISIKNNIRYSEARGWEIAKVTTTLSVSTKSKILSNTIIKTIGRSTSTKLNALSSASQQFTKKLNQIGINRILFNQ